MYSMIFFYMKCRKGMNWVRLVSCQIHFRKLNFCMKLFQRMRDWISRLSLLWTRVQVSVLPVCELKGLFTKWRISYFWRFGADNTRALSIPSSMIYIVFCWKRRKYQFQEPLKVRVISKVTQIPAVFISKESYFIKPVKDKIDRNNARVSLFFRLLL